MIILSLLINFIAFSYGSQTTGYEPEQIHLSLAANGFDIVITWSTMNNTNQSLVQFGTNHLDYTTSGTYEVFRDDGSEKRPQEIHRVKLTGLKSETKYSYRVGSVLAWSKVFYFNTFPETSDWSPRFVIYGDLGVANGFSIPHLVEEVSTDMYDVVLHDGDFAYNFHENSGKQGDIFMNQIEPIAAHIPYLTSVGNHESTYNFSHYRNRFTMPGDNQGLYFSINIGPVHIISFSSEFYYFLGSNEVYSMDNVRQQYEWLEADLKEAQKNRDQQPWILVMAHRPMYCTSTGKLGDDCTKILTKTRVGVGSEFEYGLEKLFFDYGVDIEVWAHEHTYERFYPMFNYSVYNGSVAQPFINPRAPVHILTGSAGCREKEDDFTFPAPEYSAARSEDYGYTRFTAFNKTHVYFEQVSVKEEPIHPPYNSRLADQRKVIDSFWLIQNNHGPFHL